MNSYTLHTLESAPVASKSLLEKSIKDFGMIPNLHAVMASAPNVLDAYQTLHTLFNQTSFTDEEKTVVWQTVNHEHGCHYCVPAHTAIAHMMKVDLHIINNIVQNKTLPNLKLEQLRQTTLAVVRQRGILSDDQQQQFFEVGYEVQQLLEIILGVSQKVMSNYINHIAKTPLDMAFKPFA